MVSMLKKTDVIRQAAMLAVLAANSALSEVAAGVRGSGFEGDVVSTVRSGSVATLFLASFLLIVALMCGRPLITEMPPFTMYTIWAHVYGLGLLVFVTVYCLMAVSSPCVTSYTIAFAGVSLDDILARHRESIPRRAALLLCTLLSVAAVVSAAYQSPDIEGFAEAVDAGNWFVILCGGVLPLVSPFIFTVVRGPQHYTPGTVVEFIYFAAPFAVILSLVVLGTLSVIPPAPSPPLAPEDAPPLPPLFVSLDEANRTLAQLAENRSVETKVVDRILLVTAADVAMPLLPLTMFPAIYLTVKSAFLFSTVDFLAAFAVVGAGKQILHMRGGGPSPAWPVVFAALAFAARLAASYHDRERDGRELYQETGGEEKEKLAGKGGNTEEADV